MSDPIRIIYSNWFTQQQQIYTLVAYILLAAPRLDFFSLTFFSSLYSQMSVCARNLHTIFLLIKQRILNEYFACMLRRIKNDPTTTTFSSPNNLLPDFIHSKLSSFTRATLFLLLSISMFKIRSTTHESPACMLIFMAPPLWLCYLCGVYIKPSHASSIHSLR